MDRRTPPSRFRPDTAVSQLFDCAFYAAQAGIQGDLGRCVAHYLREGATAGYSPHPLFDPAAYLADNPDVAETTADPFFHFISRGIREGRRHTVPKESAAYISGFTVERLRERRISAQARTLGWVSGEPSEWRGQIGIVSASSLGNRYFGWIGDRIANALRADGVVVYRLDQNSERPRAPAFDLVVAPHEFFELGAGRARWHDLEFTTAILLNTAPPGTASYFLALSFAAPPAVLLDVIPQSAVLLQDSGRARSGHFPLGWLSQRPERAGGRLKWNRLVNFTTRRYRHEEPHDRPIDLLFVGTLTTRRSLALALLAPTLAQYRCSIHAPTEAAWERAGARHIPSFGQALRMAREARIVLHLHAGDMSYLDWGWMLSLGVEQGALVVSEPCLDFPGVEPERHFITANLENLPDQIDLLLRSAEGRRRRSAVTRQADAELPPRFDLRAELRALAFLFNRGFARCD